MAFAEFANSAELIAHYKRVHRRIFPRVVPIKDATPEPEPVEVKKAEPPFIPPAPQLPKTSGLGGNRANQIMRIVATHTGITIPEMQSEYKGQAMVRARWLAALLMRELLGYSTPQIGRQLGDRDHTTILHGIRSAKKLRETDEQFAASLETLRDQLMGTEPC